MKLDGKTVCFLGDSITEGYGASSAENGYVPLFAKAHPEAEVYNCGVSGTRLALQKKPFNAACMRPFGSRVSAMTEKAELVCVFGGTNDFGTGDMPLGQFGDKAENTFFGALYALSLALLHKYSDGKIVFFTPLHRADEWIPTMRSDGSWLLEDYGAAIEKNAAYFSFPVLDLWGVSGIQPAIPSIRQKYMPDGLHPNDAGYRRVFEIIDKFIEGL